MKSIHAEYFASLASELDAQARRVRQLIGSAHWGHDGRHKELLLMELIRRHCPSSVLVSTGFIVSPNTSDVRSSEQDILVIDISKEAPLFQQGALVITFPHTVVAAISVKTTLDSTTLKDAIDGLQTVREVTRDAAVIAEKTWCGAFFYDVSEPWRKRPQLIYESVKRDLLNNPARPPIVDDDRPQISGPNCVADSAEIAVLFDYQRNEGANTARLRGYSCPQTATAVFISCLLEHMAIHFGGSHCPFTDMVVSLDIGALTPPTFDIYPTNGSI